MTLYLFNIIVYTSLQKESLKQIVYGKHSPVYLKLHLLVF